jgi:hypothetical protein
MKSAGSSGYCRDSAHKAYDQTGRCSPQSDVGVPVLLALSTDINISSQLIGMLVQQKLHAIMCRMGRSHECKSFQTLSFHGVSLLVQ